MKTWISLPVALALGACGTEETLTGGDVALRINEVMPSNSTSYADSNKEYDDWIELYNPSDQDVSLDGYTISDKVDEPYRVALTDKLTIKADGYLVLWADGQSVQGPDHLPFKLSASGEGVYLSGPSGTLLDKTEFGAAAVDVSFARFPDATGTFSFCVTATPGQPNGPSCKK